MASERVLSIVTGLSGKLSQVGTIGVSLGQLQRCVRLAANLAASLAAKMAAKMAAHLAGNRFIHLAPWADLAEYTIRSAVARLVPPSLPLS